MLLRNIRRPITTMCLRASPKQATESHKGRLQHWNRNIFPNSNNLPMALQPPSSSHSNLQRPFSSPSTPPSAFTSQPPSELTFEMAQGVQNATLLYIRHGLGRRRLDDLSHQATTTQKQEDPSSTLVLRWQRMMEVFLGTQVHVLAGLGYPPTEQGIALYNQQLAMIMQTSAPDIQEGLRIQGRDLWREVLGRAFGLYNDEEELEVSQMELSIVDARNMMHRISLRMQDPIILEKVAHKVASLPTKSNSPQEDITTKHTAVQEVLVHDVYLGTREGETQTLVEECGFGSGERGYVQLQCVMAEHQQDPLVTQYMGGAMMKLMDAAGIDVAGLQQSMPDPKTN